MTIQTSGTICQLRWMGAACRWRGWRPVGWTLYRSFSSILSDSFFFRCFFFGGVNVSAKVRKRCVPALRLKLLKSFVLLTERVGKWRINLSESTNKYRQMVISSLKPSLGTSLSISLSSPHFISTAMDISSIPLRLVTTFQYFKNTFRSLVHFQNGLCQLFFSSGSGGFLRRSFFCVFAML